jgi:hypothetical protein
MYGLNITTVTSFQLMLMVMVVYGEYLIKSEPFLSKIKSNSNVMNPAIFAKKSYIMKQLKKKLKQI